jgi:hypothetical protein
VFNLKGQVSIEFLASFFLYLLAVVAVFQVVSGDVPAFDQSMSDKRIHIEAKYVSDQVLTQTGYHSFGPGGENWQKNSSTQQNIENFGLASDYLLINQSKLESTSTIGNSGVNYTEFTEIVGADNQYLFNFTWTPVVEASKHYEKGNPPAGIQEPTTSLYSSADQEIHYGDIRLNGERKYFLISSHQTEYNTTYISQDRDFSSSAPQGLDSLVSFGGRDFEVIGFQNRRYDRGGLLVLESHVKEFGATLDNSGDAVKFNRYVSYDAEGSEMEPMRVEVYAW